MVGVPMKMILALELNFITGRRVTKEDDGSTTDEPRSYDNGDGAKDYPILTNEMTGLKAGNDKLTPMTTGALVMLGIQ